jgi:site-specific recombinase XerD
MKQSVSSDSVQGFKGELAAGEMCLQVSPLPVQTLGQKNISLDQNPAVVYLARLSLGSRRTMQDCLNIVAQWVSSGSQDALSFSWHNLRYQHTQAIRSALLEGKLGAKKASTVNKYLAALRGVLKECWRLGRMSAEDFNRAADLECLKETTLPKGRALSNQEIGAILAACGKDESVIGKRDAAIVAVLYSCGLRRSELVALDLADYEESAGAVRVRSGKGKKERL